MLRLLRLILPHLYYFAIDSPSFGITAAAFRRRFASLSFRHFRAA